MNKEVALWLCYGLVVVLASASTNKTNTSATSSVPTTPSTFARLDVWSGLLSAVAVFSSMGLFWMGVAMKVVVGTAGLGATLGLTSLIAHLSPEAETSGLTAGGNQNQAQPPANNPTTNNKSTPPSSTSATSSASSSGPSGNKRKALRTNNSNTTPVQNNPPNSQRKKAGPSALTGSLSTTNSFSSTASGKSKSQPIRKANKTTPNAPISQIKKKQDDDDDEDHGDDDEVASDSEEEQESHEEASEYEDSLESEKEEEEEYEGEEEEVELPRSDSNRSSVEPALTNLFRRAAIAKEKKDGIPGIEKALDEVLRRNREPVSGEGPAGNDASVSTKKKAPVVKAKAEKVNATETARAEKSKSKELQNAVKKVAALGRGVSGIGAGTTNKKKLDTEVHETGKAKSPKLAAAARAVTFAAPKNSRGR